jgi:glycosyltransferase 2 family protein
MRLLAVALVVLLGVRLWQLWHKHPVHFSQVEGAVFALAVAMSVVAVAAYGLVWPYLLRRLGVRAGVGWIGLFFTSQLGKYLPGSVWQYAGRVGMAKRRGVPVQTALVSIVAEVVLSSVAAGVLSLLVVPAWIASVVLAGVVLAGLVALRLAPRAAPVVTGLLERTRIERATFVAVVRAAPVGGLLYIPVLGAYGLAFWLTARALFAVPASQLGIYIGTFALAWLAGLAAVFAPGGIGVREAVIAALLSSRLGEAHAIVLAATSRIVLFAIDLVLGVLSLSLPALLRRQPAGARP